jgi:hypothetical protein
MRHGRDMKRAISRADRRAMAATAADIEAGRLTPSQAALKLRWRLYRDNSQQDLQEAWANPSGELKNSYRTSLIQRIGEARVRDLDKLLDHLVAKHKIDDRFRLERAVDTAMLIYQGYDAVNKDDVRKLMKHLPGVVEVLARDENDHRLADMFTDRDRNLIEGAPWNMEEATQIVMRFRRVKEDLVEMLDILRRPRRRGAYVKLHGVVALLERYWAALPGKTVARHFTPKDNRNNRQLAKSEAMAFIEAVLGFIDPGAVKKLPNATRRRLKGVSQTLG